jgi:hypothetical protein
MIELLLPCGFDTLEHSWVKATIGICTLADYSVAMKHQHVYARSLPPEVYGGEVKFGIGKLGAICVHPCPNMLAIVYCGIPKVGAEPSIVVRLWKWFTGWVEGLGIDIPPVDGPLMCGLV